MKKFTVIYAIDWCAWALRYRLCPSPSHLRSGQVLVRNHGLAAIIKINIVISMGYPLDAQFVSPVSTYLAIPLHKRFIKGRAITLAANELMREKVMRKAALNHKPGKVLLVGVGK